MNKTFRYIFVAIMAIIMVTVMAFVGTSLNYGWREGFLMIYLRTWVVMTPIAYITALVAVPIADKYTKRILGVKEDKEKTS
jgi:hypothetical protein